MVQQKYASSSYHSAGLQSKPSDYGTGSGKSDLKEAAFGKQSMGSGSSLSSMGSGRSGGAMSSGSASSSASASASSPWGQFQNASHFKHMHNY